MSSYHVAPLIVIIITFSTYPLRILGVIFFDCLFQNVLRWIMDTLALENCNHNSSDNTWRNLDHAVVAIYIIPDMVGNIVVICGSITADMSILFYISILFYVSILMMETIL